jgi:hypothetical protein
MVKTNGAFSSIPVFLSQIALFGRACHYTIIGMVSVFSPLPKGQINGLNRRHKNSSIPL